MLNNQGQELVRCAIYTRTTEMNESLEDLSMQRSVIESYIKSRESEGWQMIDKEYEDEIDDEKYEDESDCEENIKTLPELKKLFEDIKKRQIDFVIVYKINRISRSMKGLTKIIKFFQKHKVGFISLTESFNTEAITGKFMLEMILGFAEMDKSLL